MTSLPIDDVLPEVLNELRQAGAVVLLAPPGAGKTTRVPWALAESEGFGEILVSEPRRLAARLAAQRVAAELDERVGHRVGYTVRFEDVSGPRTKLRYLTDGLLQRRLLGDPNLDGVRAVVLDEFHERRLASDLSLALLRRLRETRPDLGVLVMSATLDARPVAEFLDCPVVESQGRMFSLDIEHQTRPDDRPIEKRIASATRTLLERTEGDILVFVPGVREIERTLDALGELARKHDLLLAPLHGELPLPDQTRAVKRAERRKVVVSTNVAESSVTIENVTGVVDSGLARIATHDAWSGLTGLGVRKISQAAADQRAGRAGRTRPGQAIRLYTRGDYRTRPAAEMPEILRLDLSEALLALHGAGIADPKDLAWLTAPKPQAMAGAEALLRELGAVDPSGAVTGVGRRMGALPLHPRLARVVVSGAERGVADECCLVAALLEHRDFRLDVRRTTRGRANYDGSGNSDVLELLNIYQLACEHDFDKASMHQLGFDARTLRQIRKAHQQLTRLVKSDASPNLDEEQREEAISIALLSGYVDRLAQRAPGERRLHFANGKTAELSPHSVVHDASLLVAVSASEQMTAGRKGRVVVNVASRIRPEWLLDLFVDRLEESEELSFQPSLGRVERCSRIRFGKLVLEESRRPAEPSREAGRVLARAAKSRGPASYDPDGQLAALERRLEVLGEQCPELEGVPASLDTDALLQIACERVTSLDELATRGPFEEALGALPPPVVQQLESSVPRYVTLPNGQRLRVHYEPDKPPWIESWLQDFFSVRKALTLCEGRLPLSVHLLAPNRRAVQVTTDLENFWHAHYPKLRQRLMRRYPKHSWPEDGATATPPPARARGRRPRR